MFVVLQFWEAGDFAIHYGDFGERSVSNAHLRRMDEEYLRVQLETTLRAAQAKLREQLMTLLRSHHRTSVLAEPLLRIVLSYVSVWI